MQCLLPSNYSVICNLLQFEDWKEKALENTLSTSSVLDQQI